jgi:hypothetical protein
MRGNKGKLSASDFVWTTERSCGLTLKDFTEACYRLKSHKYDCVHEMFSRIRITPESKLTNHIEMVVEFNYY